MPDYWTGAEARALHESKCRLLIGIIGPTVEELYFRGPLLPRIDRLGAWAPVLNSGLFALYHFWSPWQLPVRLLVAKAQHLRRDRGPLSPEYDRRGRGRSAHAGRRVAARTWLGGPALARSSQSRAKGVDACGL